MIARSSSLLVGMLALVLALPAAAQWKWRNSSGQTQYSDLPPPPGTPEQSILSRPSAATAQRRAEPTRAGALAASSPAAAASGALAPSGTDPELEARRKKAEQDQQAKAKADEARLAVARAENCTRAKSQLQSLESGVRVARMNDKGEREYLDDKARADEAGRARGIVSSDCR